MSASLITEAREAIEYIAGDWPRDVKRPDHLRKAARVIGLPYSAIVAIFYGKRKRLYADEYLTLKARLNALQERRANLETAHALYAERAAATRDRATADGNAQPPGSGGAPLLGSRADQEAAGRTAAAGRSSAAGDHEREEVTGHRRDADGQ